MLPSGNDASLCLAKFFGKIIYIFHKKNTLEAIKDPEWNKRNKRDWANIFVCEMNRQARNMGLINSSYSNPHGLSDSNNKSTAEDVAKLSSHCLSNLFIKQLVSTRDYSATIENKGKIKHMQWKNTNLLLWKGFTGNQYLLSSFPSFYTFPCHPPCIPSFFYSDRFNLKKRYQDRFDTSSRAMPFCFLQRARRKRHNHSYFKS